MIVLALLAAAPVAINPKYRDLAFSYTWSAEAAAVPALDRRFRADAAKQRAAASIAARDDLAQRLKDGMAPSDWNGHSFERSWETAGSAGRLLSLAGSTAIYTGGAHGNYHTQRLIWDRIAGREVSIGMLLRPGTSWKEAIQAPFCLLLARERVKRDVAPPRPGLECPPQEDLTLVLVDRNHNGRLDHVRVTADPYVAGSYAEGEYSVEVPLTATMLTRLRPEYRSSFEPQPPLQ